MSAEPKRVELTEAEIDRESDVLALPGTNRVVFTSDENQWSKARYRKYGWVERWIVSADDLDTVKAAARREALLEAREDIRERRRRFAGLGCDEQYLMAMDDCFGLVNNRLSAALAEPERDEEGVR